MLIAAAALLPHSLSGQAQAEVIARGTTGPPLSQARPAPDFIKPDVSIVTAQPSPSEVNPAYLGPALLMKQARVDLVKDARPGACRPDRCRERRRRSAGYATRGVHS